MSSSNQRPAKRGFRSVLRCAIIHYRQSLLAVCTRTFPDETKSFEINFNVINLFNQKTALRTFRNLYRQSLPLWQPGDPVSQVLNGYDYQAIATSQGATQDPRFLQEDRFLDPITARFGIRFVF